MSISNERGEHGEYTRRCVNAYRCMRSFPAADPFSTYIEYSMPSLEQFTQKGIRGRRLRCVLLLFTFNLILTFDALYVCLWCLCVREIEGGNDPMENVNLIFLHCIVVRSDCDGVVVVCVCGYDVNDERKRNRSFS